MIKSFKNKLKNKLGNNNGFTTQDVLIAIFIILLFLSIFTTLTMNLANTSSEIKKVKNITETVTKVADRVDSIPYDNLTATSTETPITNLPGCSDLKLDSGIKITYTIAVSEIKKEKTVNLTIKNPAIKDIKMSIGKKSIEVIGTGSGSGEDEESGGSGIITPNYNAQYHFNRPNAEKEGIEKYQYGAGKPLVPIKFIWTAVSNTKKEGKWVRTTSTDPEWYSYEENIWPMFAYETASLTTTQYKGYTGTTRYPTLANNPFEAPSGATVDSKYAFVWLPRILRDVNYNSDSNLNNAQFYFAYEGTNNDIIYDRYYRQSSNNKFVYSAKLQDAYNNSYARGNLIGWSLTRTDNDHWDDILNKAGSTYRYAVPIALESRIRGINQHKSINIDGRTNNM